MGLKKLGFWGACSACTLFFCSDVRAMNLDFSSFLKERGIRSAQERAAEAWRSRERTAKEIDGLKRERDKAKEELNNWLNDPNNAYAREMKRNKEEFNRTLRAERTGLMNRFVIMNSNILKLTEENNALGNRLRETERKADEVKGLKKIFPDGSRSFVDQAEELRRNFNLAHEAAGIGRLSLNAKILAAEEETERISQKKDSATRKIAELVNTLNKVTTEKDELKNQLNEAQGKATNLENQLNEANQKVADAESKSSDESRLFMNVLKAVYENTEDKVWLENIIQNSDDQQYAVSKLLDLLKAPRQ